MNGIRHRRIRKIIGRCRDDCSAFSLVELLVMMSILLIIIFAFTPLLVSSIERIYYAGDKSEALYRGQSEMEMSIVEKQTLDGSELVFTFGEGESETEITVPGGLVDVEEYEGSTGAWLSGFVPYVPTINLFLEPLPLVEGYNQLEIVVMGKDSALEHGQEVKLFDRSGSDLSANTGYLSLISHDAGIPAGYDQYGQFTLYEGLANSGSPYTIELSWVSEGVGQIVTRARLQVVLPLAATVGSGQVIMISPDAAHAWKNRAHGLGTGIGSINALIWTGFEYLAVTDNGSVVAWANREPLKLTYQSAGNLYDLVNGGGLLVAVGLNGKIISSWNGHNWTDNSQGSATLYTVGWNEYEFIAAGAGGTVLTSTNGIDWEPVEHGLGEAFTFYGIAYGNQRWVIVGEDTGLNGGVAVVSSPEGGWVKIYPGAGECTCEEGQCNCIYPAVLHDVTYGNNSFVAVGKSDTVMVSADGNEWQAQVLDGNYLGQDYWRVIFDDLRGEPGAEDLEPRYLATGTQGLIITSPEGVNWSEIKLSTSETLKGIAVR